MGRYVYLHGMDVHPKRALAYIRAGDYNEKNGTAAGKEGRQ